MEGYLRKHGFTGCCNSTNIDITHASSDGQEQMCQTQIGNFSDLFNFFTPKEFTTHDFLLIWREPIERRLRSPSFDNVFYRILGAGPPHNGPLSRAANKNYCEITPVH